MQVVAPLKILKASAGSGKTFSLTIHFLNLLLQKESNYREILAMTFTNKATAEMKSRILEVLHALAIGDENSKIDSYRSNLLDQIPELTKEKIQEKAHRVYCKILHDYSHFTISTIDGFSQKVIRSFTYELNLDAAYQVEMNTAKVQRDLTMMLNQRLDERPDLLEWIIQYAENKIARNENWNYRQQLLKLSGLIFSENFQEFDAHLKSADTQQIFTLLNREISEKTDAFLDTLSRLILKFTALYNELGVNEQDMSQKSRNKLVVASKISHQIHKLSSKDLKEKVLDRFRDLRDNESAFTDQSKQVRHDFIAAFEPLLGEFEDMYSSFSGFIAYQAVEKNLYYLRLLKEMSDLLSNWRQENGAQLISDSQVLLSKLGLDEHGDPTFIWEKIGNRYNYFLFDEFQDTSRIQWKNYRPLLINALGNSQGRFNEHLIVGDVKQSIYRWRNGDWRILLHQAEEEIYQTFHLQSQAERERFISNDTLATNYRSLPDIIRFNNYLYERLPACLQHILNAKIDQELDEPGKVWWEKSGNNRMLIKAYEGSTQQIPPSKLADASKTGSIDIQYFPVENGQHRHTQVEEDSIQDLCHRIGEWLATGRYQPNQIGILVRTNAQVRRIIQALMDYRSSSGVFFEVISGDALNLTSNDAVLLLIETLSGMLNNSQKYIIHRAKMAYLYQLIRSKEPFDSENWLKFKSNDLQDLNGIIPQELINNWEVWQRLPLIHLVEKLIDVYDLTTDENIHLPYLLAFKDVVASFAGNGDRGIGQFLDFWKEEGDRIILPSNDTVNAIEVTTVHKSKGLAYDVVMIPFCSWKLDASPFHDFWIDVEGTPFESLGKIPVKYNSTLSQSIFYQQYYEEMLFNYMDALNTFYVATTRAIQHLYISAPEFKDTKEKLISDMLYQVLEEANEPFVLQDNNLQIENIIPPDNEKQYETDHFSLKRYPIAGALEKTLEKSTKRSINTILTMEKASQYGVLAHEILSKISKEEDIDGIIASYIEQGVLIEDNREDIKTEIHRVWDHPVMHNWFTGEYQVWNEAEILTAKGETLRPDKVFSSEKETIVLDFKFTQSDYTGHKAQIDTYTRTLEDLGYHQVKGYLYYAKVNELVEVI